ncbi:MAG: SpoIIE family protein phosphatase [Acutalibacteraceae bacterium]|nr:SpoIIE family protein phosphatase [Acutalibacteraceae bacterium]
MNGSGTVKVTEKIHAARYVFLHICSFIGAILFSKTTVFGSFMPFGIAFAPSLPGEFSLSALFGVILGSISTANGEPSVRYISAVIMSVAVKMLTNAFLNKTSFNIGMFSSGIGCAFSSVVMLLTDSVSLDEVIIHISELLIAVGVAYFISLGLPIIGGTKTLSRLSTEQLCSCVACIAIALCAVASFDIFGISPARILSVMLIISASRFGRESAGAICGVVFGFAMSIVSDNMFYIIGAYALSGLLGGIFCDGGKFATCIAFLLGHITVLSGFYGSIGIAEVFSEAVIGSVLFFSLPKGAIKKIGDFFAPAPQLARVDGLRKNMVMRMRFAGEALSDVSQTVEEVSNRLCEKNTPKLTNVFVQVENEACAKCGLRIHCFESRKSSTYDCLAQLCRTIHRSGEITPEDRPKEWNTRCISPDAVIESLKKHYTLYESRLAAERRITQIRQAVSDQMSGLSDMLSDMATELNRSERFDTETADRIDSVLRSMGIQPTDVCCKTDMSRRMTVEIRAPLCDDTIVNKRELITRLSRVCNRRFEVPCIVKGDTSMLITVCEKANYRVETGVSQICCKNEQLCGDSYSFFDDGRGKTVMILSDGMGCGGRAAVDSAMASGLISKLIKAGFGFDCSLKLINSAMLFKSSDESLATVDITSIDLFSGETEFYKAGTPETIIKKGRTIGRATCSSYPAGILRNVEFDRCTTVLEQKDIVVMFSDGVSSQSTEWVDEALHKYRNSSAQQIAEHIAQSAARRRDDGHEDDITVMVGIIRQEL